MSEFPKCNGCKSNNKYGCTNIYRFPTIDGDRGKRGGAAGCKDWFEWWGERWENIRAAAMQTKAWKPAAIAYAKQKEAEAREKEK